MTEEEFLQFALENNIPGKAYSLTGKHKYSDIIVLSKEHKLWKVYYFERGDIHSIKYHDTKSEAVLDMYNRFNKLIEQGYDLRKYWK